MMKLGLTHRDFIVADTVDLIGHTDWNTVKTREHIEFGEEEISEAIDPRCIASHRRIKPTTSACSACGDATLTTNRA